MAYMKLGEGAVGDKDQPGITEIDLNAASYDAFVGGPDTWTEAVPSDDVLGLYYGGKYNLMGVSRLTASPDPKSIVNTHYGDWPAPEIFIINE